MPAPRYRRKRVDLNKLNPYDARDMQVIDAEWRKLQARRIREGNRAHRRAARRGWFRVALVTLTYCTIGALVLGTLLAVVAILRSL